jgi:Big-like domain-containing protein
MKLTSTKVAIALSTALLAAGCSGGGGSQESMTPPAAANAAPTISTIASQTIDEGGATGVLGFTVGDAETSADALSVSVSSSNSSMVPADGFEMTGSGSSRALVIFPAAEQSGTATITIAVRDSGGAVTSSKFDLTVTPLLRAQFSGWLRTTVLPRELTSNPVGEAADEGQQLPQVEDINRIRVQDDAATFDDLIPPEQPDEV